MRIRDLEPWTVYRLTASGTAQSKLASRGPWVYAATWGDFREDYSRHPRFHPVAGPPPLQRGLPLAGDEGRYGYTLDSDPIRQYLPASRVASRICTLAEWSDWWVGLRAAEDRAAEQRATQDHNRRSDAVWLVASLIALGYDLGGGPWDLGNEWARYVSHVLGMLPNQRHLTALALADHANKVIAANVSARRTIDAAERWLVSRSNPTNQGAP
jgi:hypothetical protein